MGSLEKSEDNSHPDRKRRICSAASVMSSLSRIWRDSVLQLGTKIRVMSVLLRTLVSCDKKTYEAFHMKWQFFLYNRLSLLPMQRYHHASAYRCPSNLPNSISPNFNSPNSKSPNSTLLNSNSRVRDTVMVSVRVQRFGIRRFGIRRFGIRRIEIQRNGIRRNGKEPAYQILVLLR